MRAGYWGNYDTGKIFQIDDHELWINRGRNAAELGVSAEVKARSEEFPDRVELLRFLFANAPVMRFRGHGTFVTIEFNSSDWDKPLQLIETWGKAHAGPFLGLNIVNFHRTKGYFVLWKDFNRLSLP